MQKAIIIYVPSEMKDEMTKKIGERRYTGMTEYIRELIRADLRKDEIHG